MSFLGIKAQVLSLRCKVLYSWMPRGAPGSRECDGSSLFTAKNAQIHDLPSRHFGLWEGRKA